MSTHLDRSYPQGSPTSPTCRQCNGVRTNTGLAWFCPTCDGTALQIANANGRAS